MTGTAAQPNAQRIEALDFLRGTALFGILLMNINGMGLGPAYDNPAVAGGATGVNLWTWFVINVGFEGTQRALFSILFGAGIILLTSRLEAAGRPDAADIHVRRNLWLIGFGLVNAWILLFPGDILYYYGITALFLYAFRKLAGGTLLALGLASFLLGAAWSGLETKTILDRHDQAVAAARLPEAQRTPDQKRAIAEDDSGRIDGPPPPAYAQMKKAMTAGYFSAQRELAPVITHFQSWQLYRYFFDIFGMMMIGMGLFRLGVLTLERSTRTYAAMMVGGYALGLAGNLAEARWIMDHGFTVLAYHQAAISYDFSRLAMTFGHLGLLMLFLRSGLFGWLRRSMAAVGRMALSNYLTHSLVSLVIFILLGWWGGLERHQLYFIVFAVWLAQLLISPWWLRHFHFGPVEWVWRALTYGTLPPFRRSEAQPPVQPGPLAAA